MVFKTIGAIVVLIALAACSGAGSGSSPASSVLPGSGNGVLPSDSLGSTWQSLNCKTVQPSGTDLAAFAFSEQTNCRLLITANDPSKNPLLGNHLGATISAAVAVANVTGVFIYSGEPSCGNYISNVRLYFTSTGGPFAYTDYWWSDSPPGSAVLTPTTSGTLTATLDPTTAWSDWNGQPSSGLATAFNAAASNITSVGLSFGGGCFFENGVGTSDGSGIFTLQSFSDGTRL